MSIITALMMAFAVGDQIDDASTSSPGTISVEAKSEGTSGALRGTFVGAVDQALAARGFTTIDQVGHAALVAEVSVSRDQVGTVSAAVAKSDLAAQTGEASSRVGAGVSFALPSSRTRIVPLQRTRLELRIRRRDSATILWQGTALTVRAASTPKGRDSAVAADLSEALLREYPLQSGETISIP